MTNHWNDIANSDCILVMGGNPAENHPASFSHILKAKDKGGVLIHVDPRFTRTSAKADIYAPLRSGTDIAFLGGMIKYIIDDIEKNPAGYNMTYITEYTTAPYLVNPAYKGPAELDGLFSGYAGALNETDAAHVRQDDMVLPDGRRRHPDERQDVKRSQLRLPADEETVRPLYA
jgi:formate dehydrogenase major subunit